MDKDMRSLELSRPLSTVQNLRVFASDNEIPKSMYVVVSQKVYLKEKWRSPQDFFEVTYTTLPNFCPKCANRGVLDDISFNIRKELLLNRDESLLYQNMEKFIVTILGSNPFHSFIGTSLVSLLGEKISDPDFLTTKIIQEIVQALNKLSDLQNQYKQAGRKLTDGEQLNTVDDIQVNFENDPTILRADITVTAKSGKSITLSQYLKISGF